MSLLRRASAQNKETSSVASPSLDYKNMCRDQLEQIVLTSLYQ